MTVYKACGGNGYRYEMVNELAKESDKRKEYISQAAKILDKSFFDQPVHFDKLLENSASEEMVIVLLSGEKVVATLVLQGMRGRKPGSYFYKDDTANIGWVAVDPGHRKRGAGKIIVNIAECEAKRNGKIFVELQSDDKNADFYKRLGYDAIFQGNDYNHFKKHL